jgi:O-antigen ligase
LLPVAILAGSLAVAIIVPLTPHLPFTFQRALSFLPLDVSPEARESAQGSFDWRVNMWKALLPQVPQYLLLGKGMAISPEDYNEMMGTPLGIATGNFDPSQDPMALAYDYHNGVLSVILPFGIWGMIAYLWFMAASLFVLYRNWKYGNPELRSVNALLFVVFLFEVVSFLSCYAGLSLPVAVPFLVGRVGLSIALNGGVCRPEPQPVPAKEAFLRPQGAWPRSRPRPAFPR